MRKIASCVWVYGGGPPLPACWYKNDVFEKSMTDGYVQSLLAIIPSKYLYHPRLPFWLSDDFLID